MAKKKQNLPKFTVDFNEKKDSWELQNDKTNKVVKRFETKDDLTKGGVLKKLVGKEGGSVKIQKKNGKFQQERTYPKGRDPKSSKG